jgi:hypothetical protein
MPFEIFTAVKIWILVFCVMMRCSLEDGGNRFLRNDDNHLFDVIINASVPWIFIEVVNSMINKQTQKNIRFRYKSPYL